MTVEKMDRKESFIKRQKFIGNLYPISYVKGRFMQK